VRGPEFNTPTHTKCHQKNKREKHTSCDPSYSGKQRSEGQRFGASPGQKNKTSETLSQKYPTQKRAGRAPITAKNKQKYTALKIMYFKNLEKLLF
jgi:hypothetical protein